MAKNFGDLPGQYNKQASAKIIILPVPFDGTSTWLKGAGRGPAAVIEASANMELYDIETNSEVYQHGIYTAKPVQTKSRVEQVIKKVEQTVAAYLKQEKFVVVIGGEHSISLGSIKAHGDYYKNISVLQLDAHADLRESYLGSKYNHACVMARVKEFCPIVQVGIRSLDISEKKYIDRNRVFFAQQIIDKKNWQDQAIAKLAKKVYITIDLDVLDPSVLPSTGTPEPGGLLWYQLIDFLRKVIFKKEVVGFDAVELCPNRFDKSSDFLAAKLIYKLLSYKFKK